MKVLLLSAYAAQSHVHWQQSLQAMFDQWQWCVLSLPPRHFSWRVRGNPLYWAIAERTQLEQDYDLLIATSMVDLATLRGLVPSLARVPAVVYFHENQFDYPRRRQQLSLLEAQMVSLYSALAADSIVFNSTYNMDSFVAGCSALLDKLPDRVPGGVIPILRDKATVLPVPLDLEQSIATEAAWPGKPGELPDRPLRLLWLGRFEYDKGGEGLLQILERLEQDGLNYELAVIGQQFRSSPDVFRQIERGFSHRLVQFGYMDDPRAYRALLRGADVVLSTALHEFQGLAVLQAVANGCLPVVPRRLVYPEIYPTQYCYDSNRDDPGLEARSAARLIRKLGEQLEAGGVQAPDVSTYGTRLLTPRYREVLLAVAAAQDS
jgi:glycosyltransferase involved in cell wall biosynthesis